MNLRRVLIVVLSAVFCISIVRAASPPPLNPPRGQLTIPAEELLRRFQALEKDVARLGAVVATLEQQLVSSTCDAGQFPLCCPVGDTFCPAMGCVELSSNSFNCGACGNTCDAPLSCVHGVCSLTCASNADCGPRGDTCWPDTGTCGCGAGALCDRLDECEDGLCAATNLVFNGDFELGNTGFSSEYDPPPSQNWQDGRYWILRNPIEVGYPLSMGDHTTGDGLMMLVETGWIGPNKVVWSQTVAVQPGTDYNLSAWMHNNFGGVGPVPYEARPRLEFLINGQAVGTVTSDQMGVWTPFTGAWNSGSHSNAQIVIIDRNQTFAGNDFALDDISLERGRSDLSFVLPPAGSTQRVNPGRSLDLEIE